MNKPLDITVSNNDMRDELSKLMICRDCWVSLLREFSNNSTLKYYYERAEHETPIPKEQNAQIYLMKRAIGLMVSDIEESGIITDKKKSNTSPISSDYEKLAVIYNLIETGASYNLNKKKDSRG